jgi:colanic acid biosynthesis protein WcaH
VGNYLHRPFQTDLRAGCSESDQSGDFRLKPSIPNELYSKIHAEMPIICVDIVVSHEDKIFLIKRAKAPAKGEWWFPGGRLLRGEGLLHAASRIAKLETNLSIRNPVYLGYGETMFKTDPFGHEKGTHTVNFVFAAHATVLDVMAVTLDDNHLAYSTFTYGEIYTSEVHPYVKRFVALSEGVFRE